jgi:hypothetical protein
MSGIDPSVVCHHLAVNPGIKPVLQRKRKIDKERKKAVDEEVKKLKDDRFIKEIKYPTSLPIPFWLRKLQESGECVWTTHI